MHITKEMYLGLSTEHLVKAHDFFNNEIEAQSSALQAFSALQADAKKHGFDLVSCSAFRSFERQGAIFSAKFNGLRPILDINEKPLEPIPHDPIERLEAMLIFSAMPGFSRHHFGSDFDVYAPNKLPSGQSLKLTYHEYLEGSYFYELGLYLKENLSRFDFFNPYAASTGTSTVEVSGDALHKDKSNSSNASPRSVSAVGFEPWHISHAPSAYAFLKAYDCEVALSYVESTDLPFAPYARKVMTPERIESMLHLSAVK